jgi:hypothetical protein
MTIVHIAMYVTSTIARQVRAPSLATPGPGGLAGAWVSSEPLRITYPLAGDDGLEVEPIAGRTTGSRGNRGKLASRVGQTRVPRLAISVGQMSPRRQAIAK